MLQDRSSGWQFKLLGVDDVLARGSSGTVLDSVMHSVQCHHPRTPQQNAVCFRSRSLGLVLGSTDITIPTDQLLYTQTTIDMHRSVSSFCRLMMIVPVT